MYKVIVMPVAGKYMGRLVREVNRDAQLNRFSNQKPELVTVMTNRQLLETPEAAERAMQVQMDKILSIMRVNQ